MHEPTLLVDGLDFGEGPRWHDGRLWYSDFHQHRIYAVSTDGTREVMVETGDERPSGLGWLPDGDLLMVAMLARQVWRVAHSQDSGSPSPKPEITVHADLSPIATWHCNDMVVAADGTAYVGNFGFDIEGDRSNPVSATLAIVAADGSVTAGPADLGFPNGAVITPDGSTLIVGETFASRMTAFDIDTTDSGAGALSGRRVWAETPGIRPDGCCLDAAGGIWIADAGGGGVVRVVEGGEVTDRIAMPDYRRPQTAYACMLGGEDGRTLFCVTAPGSRATDTVGVAGGAIWTVRVEHPAAGRP